MDLKYILKIFIIFFIILSLILFVNSIELNSVGEGFISSSKAFCDVHSGFDLEKSCQKLTKYNCGLTSCCVWTNDNKCKAGNKKSGPLFN